MSRAAKLPVVDPRVSIEPPALRCGVVVKRDSSVAPSLVRLVAALTLFLSACTGGGGTPEPSPSSSPVSRGGTLHVATGTGLVYELDPQKAYDATEWELFRCCLLRTLLSYNGRPTDEGGGELRPDLAIEVPEVSADGLTWTFHIRTDLYYAPPLADTEIVAGDFVRALEREANEGSYAFYYSVIDGLAAYGAGHAGSIVGLETPDEHTLVVRLTRPSGDLGYLFTMPATAPIPPDPNRPHAALGIAAGHDDGYGPFLVASGPYMLQGSEQLDFSATPSEQAPAAGLVLPVLNERGGVKEPGLLALVSNPSWDPASDRLRPAFVDRIDVALGPSPQSAAEEVAGGRLDLYLDGTVPHEQLADYRGDPERADLIETGQPNYTVFATINPAIPPFDDVHVRRALSYAIDKAALVEKANEAHGLTWPAFEPATHVAPDGSQAALLSSYDPYPYDPSAASSEMVASRYDDDGDGVCDATACRSVRTITLTTQFPDSGIRLIVKDAGAIGIHLAVRRLTGDLFFPDGEDSPGALPPEKGTVLAFGDNWAADFPSASQFGELLFDSRRLPPDCCNRWLLGASAVQLKGWGFSVTSVPDVDTHLANCIPRAGDSGLDCWVRFDQYLMQEVVPLVPLFSPLYEFVLSPRVAAFSIDQWTALPALDHIALASGHD